MLVTPLPYGRMGNRLMVAAHFLAHVEKNGGAYWHLAFWPYNRYFEGTRGKPFLRYVSSRGPRVEGAAKRRWPVSFWFELLGLDRGGGDVHMDEEPFLGRERRSRVLFCGAWAFRDRTATRECADAIRRFFRPVAKWREPAEACVAAAREGADRLVAVHMRLTDYAKFNGGAWFYAPADYRRWMEQTAALLPGRTRFLLFSDVPVETLLPELLKPHAESAKSESHAESAETAEAESHAESAETAEAKFHAESAETAEAKSHAGFAKSAEFLGRDAPTARPTAAQSRACFELAYVDNNGRLVITDRFGTPLPRAAEPREANAARPARGAARSAAPASGLARSAVAMHAMSLCDYILGPPSSFSCWASFMGRVPRLQLQSRDQVVRLEDFAEHIA